MAVVIVLDRFVLADFVYYFVKLTAIRFFKLIVVFPAKGHGNQDRPNSVRLAQAHHPVYRVEFFFSDEKISVLINNAVEYSFLLRMALKVKLRLFRFVRKRFPFFRHFTRSNGLLCFLDFLRRLRAVSPFCRPCLVQGIPNLPNNRCRVG